MIRYTASMPVKAATVIGIYSRLYSALADEQLLSNIEPSISDVLIPWTETAKKIGTVTRLTSRLLTSHPVPAKISESKRSEHRPTIPPKTRAHMGKNAMPNMDVDKIRTAPNTTAYIKVSENKPSSTVVSGSTHCARAEPATKNRNISDRPTPLFLSVPA